MCQSYHDIIAIHLTLSTNKTGISVTSATIHCTVYTSTVSYLDKIYTCTHLHWPDHQSHYNPSLFLRLAVQLKLGVSQHTAIDDKCNIYKGNVEII